MRMRYALAAFLFALCTLPASEIDITGVPSADFGGSVQYLDPTAPGKDAAPEPSLAILAYAALAFGVLMLEGRRRPTSTILDIQIPRLYSSSKLPDIRWSRIR